MDKEPPLQVGTRVLVSRADDAYNALLETEEVGTVLGVGLEYSGTDDDGVIHKDGILVKLQISNTRGIYPPRQVTRLQIASSPAPTKRRSRRAQVTPSPSVLEVVGGDESLAALDGDSQPRPAEKDRKRNLKDVSTAFANDSDDDDAVDAKKSKYFKSDDDDDEGSGDDAAEGVSFRVQVTPSSSGKCQECNQTIARNILRVQPCSQKRGWYHVSCAGETFAAALPAAANDMEGFSDLSPGEQRLLQSQWNNGQDTTDMDISQDDSETVEDVPLASLKRPAAKRGGSAAKKKGGENREASSEGDNNAINADIVDDDMLRASDTDSDDLKDMPYRVEYATTGRAACRGCDERVAKDSLRVAEQPLFRGKPGFTVYRHLECTTFPEEITRLQDVGGWRRLKKVDRDAVMARIETSKILVEEENQELQPDELVQVGFEGEIRTPPKGLSASLLPFQVEGFSWMVHQERHVPEIRGGILADEMGMGKTLQTITSILDNRPKLQWAKPGAKHPPAAPDLEDRKREEKMWNDSLEAWKFEMDKCNVPQKLITLKPGNKKDAPMGARAGTLVVCPVIALYQWRDEIAKFTEEKALSVCCYHGPNRAKEFPRELLCKYDVVLTTYQVIEADFRKMVSPNKVKCPNCGGGFRIDKLKIHLKYFCGESAQRTEAQARQRRTADRHSGRGGGNGGSGGSGQSNNKKKASKSATKTKAKGKVHAKSKKLTKTAPKKTVRAKKAAGYDSDSDISVDEDLDLNSSRPRRSAATSASKKLAASAKQWGGQSDASDSDEFSDNESSSGGSSDDRSVKHVPNKRAVKKSTVQSESDDPTSESESEDEEAVVRATKKQKLALARARGNKKGKEGKKVFRGESKNDKGRGKKKPLPESSSDEESSDDEDRDPMEGIDLDKLLKEAMEGSRASVLHTLCWWRVVLDEAHMIKSRSSQTAAAAFALTSIHRWCLSGTPLQNRVGELYSLIRFLRIDPMAHYFCRKEGCDCKSVHYRMRNGKCLDCGHGTIQHFSHFNKHVLNPIQRAGYQGDGRRAMMKLKTEVLDKSLLRRTKLSRAEDMNLPPRVVQIKTVRLHPIEEDFYNALYTQTKSSFDDYVTEGTLLNNYAHIFDLLTKMRQAVDHPYMIVYSKKNAGTLGTQGAPAVANGSIDCDLCHEPPTDRVVSSCCGAAFCRSCVVDYMSPALEDLQQEGTHCPTCRAPFSVDLSQASSDVVDDSTLAISQGTGNATDNMPSLKEMSHVSSGSILRRINLAEFATSTKIEALVQELIAMRQKHPGSKALVFSQFVNMLDLVRWRLHSDPCLQQLGIGVRILHGGMNVQSRDEALKAFKEDNSVRVLLMSLKAGGVALNLCVASHCYLLDPWWNPAAEMQAIDRTHRLGQYRPIRAVRFIAEGTVEERVLQLQEKKRLVFDGTVGRDAASLKMLTVDDMKSLFA